MIMRVGSLCAALPAGRGRGRGVAPGVGGGGWAVPHAAQLEGFNGGGPLKFVGASPAVPAVKKKKASCL